MFQTVANGLLVPTGDFGPSDFSVGYQNGASLAALQGGGFIAVWDDAALGGQARFFDADGAPVGSAFKVTGVWDGEVVVTALPNGNFVIAWTHALSLGEHDIHAQIYTGSGAPIGNELTVSTFSGGSDGEPNIVALSGGGFVVTWRYSSGTGFENVRAQVYAADGSRVGGQVAMTGAPGPHFPSTVALEGGGFVISWSAYGDVIAGAGNPGIQAQIFSATGSAISGIFSINSFLAGVQDWSNLAALPGGGFIAAWSDTQYASNTGQDGIWFQRFDSSGARVGPETQVTNGGISGSRNPEVEIIPGTGFLVVWEQSDAPQAWLPHLRGQLFDFSGNEIGQEFGIAQIEPGTQSVAGVARLSEGQIVVSWENRTTGPDDLETRATIFVPPLQGTDGADILNGTAHRDFILGGAGDDRIMAGAGVDQIDGGAGADIIDAGGGTDTLTGGLGADTLTGGAQSDVFVDTAAGLDGDTIIDFANGDRIVISDATASQLLGWSNGLVTFGSAAIALSNLQNASIIAAAAPEGGVQIVYGGTPIIVSGGSSAPAAQQPGSEKTAMLASYEYLAEFDHPASAGFAPLPWEGYRTFDPFEIA